jgi:signal transduction histidine kinase/DNA-binding NarL/FixJ family response regulator
MKNNYPLFRLRISIPAVSCFLCCIVHFNLQAQQPDLVPDDERDLREATSDSARANALQHLAFDLAHSDPARSMAYGEEALRVAKKSGNPQLMADCQNGVGWAIFSRGDLVRARILLDSSIQYMRAVKNYRDLVAVCNNQGWVCLKQGDNLGALRYFKEGLNAAELSGHAGRIAFINRSLGSYYNAQKEYDKAIPQFERASSMFEAIGDSMQASDCLVNLGNAHIGLKRYHEAIEYYKKALPIKQRTGNKFAAGMALESWGLALSQLGQYDEAFSKLKSARALFVELDERIEMAGVDDMYGITLMQKGDTAAAISHLERAYQTAARMQLNDILLEVLPALHTAYAAVGLPDKAYKTLLAYQNMRDTTAAEAKATELQRLQTEFETERREKDLQIKSLENAHLQSRLWLAITGLCLALLAVFATWYRAWQRRKTNAALEAKNQEILAQKAEADRLRIRAEHSEAAKEKFLAAMSHEIRTPMNAIVGLSQLLDAGNHDPTTARNISIIRQSGEHLMTILNDILDLAKIDALKIELNPQPLALLPQLELIRDTFAESARKKGVELRLETAPDLPKAVVGDPVRLGQILNNLVSNALKFTDSGEVVIAARLDDQPNDTPPNHAVIHFSVRDTGIGIPLEKQASVFEEFAQADPGIAQTYGGTGLGLSIARSLVEQMGGALQLQSQPGVGSEFFFTLTLPLADASVLADQAPTNRKTDIPQLICKAPVRILLVEDNEFNQSVAAQTVAAICAEIRFDMVEHGETAIEWVQKEHFDLVLTDLQMPGLDGYQTARLLRAAHFERPIIALTASAVRTDEPKCIEAGMQAMLLKPIAPSEMADLLLRYLPEKLALAQENQQDTSTAPVIQDAEIPPSLLHYAGGNATIAAKLLTIIRTELKEYLPALSALQAESDDSGIRKRVHKIRPQLIALGMAEHKPLLDAIELNTNADAAFWANVSTLQTILHETIANL